VAQWQRLGVSWEEEIQSGFGHNTWPDSAMENGFNFLVDHVVAHRIRPGGRRPDAFEEAATDPD